MNKVLQATYHDGNLVLDEKLDTALEGKKLTLILGEEESSSQSELEQKERTRKFLEWAQQYSAKLPPTINSIGKKPMSDNVFLDTNLWVYFFAKDPPDKVERVTNLINTQLPSLIISTQVLGELYRKGRAGEPLKP